uniref:Fatty acid synthase n=1 Tax=Heterorhabditis bacteriophora TaxID=37862 RepID=A0A1I7WIK0_HETBA
MMRFSIWRGKYVLILNFVNNLLMPHSSVMCLRISYVAGGSICVTIRSEQSQTVHLEPIELKKLQTKSVFEYLADIAESANINYILTAHHSLIRVSEVVRKHSIGADVMKMKDVSSNITHTGSLEEMHGMRFSPLRIAVVTCREVFSALPVVPTSSHSNGYANTSVLHLECSCNSRSSFADQLDQLMKAHGKTADDVLELVGYTSISQYTVDQFIPPQDSAQDDWQQSALGALIPLSIATRFQEIYFAF